MKFKLKYFTRKKVLHKTATVVCVRTFLFVYEVIRESRYPIYFVILFAHYKSSFYIKYLKDTGKLKKSCAIFSGGYNIP